MKIRDRIKGLRRVKASKLVPNPKNWRTHPEAQQSAMRGALDELGYVDALLARELPDGRLQLIDGHLRAEVTPDQTVPVLVLDVSEAEADKILATLDPLAAMAERDAGKLADLVATVETDSAGLQALLDSLAGAQPADVADDVAGEPPAEEDAESEPGMVWQLGPHRLACGDSTDEAVRASVLDIEPQLQIVDPPFDLDYSAWPLLPSACVVMVWQRGAQALLWEAAMLSDWGCHELVFTGGVRGWPAAWFPCCVHDTVRMWRDDRAEKCFDSAVLAASGCRTVADGTRPFSVQEHAGGVLTGYGGMSWGKALIAMEIAMSYVPGGAGVWDPCAGSGTSLIAAHRHGRVWRGVEYQPRWCDLILRRWEEATGVPPQRLDTQRVGSV